MILRGKLPDGWSKKYDDKTDKWVYFNKNTNETSLKLPNELTIDVSPNKVDHRASDSPCNDPEHVEFNDWVEFSSEKYQRKYWKNKNTGNYHFIS